MILRLLIFILHDTLGDIFEGTTAEEVAGNLNSASDAELANIFSHLDTNTMFDAGG